MANEGVENSLGEEPLFTDKAGNVFFPQEESDHVLRERIKEEERLKRLAETKKVVPKGQKKFSGRRGIHSPIDNSAGMRGIGKYRSNR